MARRRLWKRPGKTGLAPGTLVHVGEKRVEKVEISLIDYDEKRCDERTVDRLEDVFVCKDTDTVSWINVNGLHEVEVIDRIGRHFGIHPLVLEDIADTGQRPKAEDHADYFFVVFKMLTFDPAADALSAEQVSAILGPGWVISFQERAGDVFDSVRDRIRTAKGRIRQMKADYLLHALMDSVVDQYFVILETFGEKVEALEERLVADPAPQTLQSVKQLKRDMIVLRRSVWPLREAISELDRSESNLIHKPTRAYFRNVYDHTVQVMDAIESVREMLSGMQDLYLSSISNRMNEVMKVLTIIATIFIPLTFVAGIYGMNFDPGASPLNMPELKWRFGYLAALGVMAVIVAGMVVYFRKKRWL